MKTSAILIGLSLLILSGTPDASAQSFKERLKNAVKKVEQKVVPQKLPQHHDTTAGANDKNVNNRTSAVLFGENHTALFAPVGEPVDAKWGIKSVGTVKPPKEEAKQPDWNDARPSLLELDNKSLVEEYLVLYDCMESNYVSHSGPIACRYFETLRELDQRTEVLNKMVEHYNEANSFNINDDEDKYWADQEINWIIRNVLNVGAYKRLIRSSLAPLFTLKGSFIEDSTREYFDAHGGYENAHKAKWTVLKEPKANK